MWFPWGLNLLEKHLAQIPIHATFSISEMSSLFIIIVTVNVIIAVDSFPLNPIYFSKHSWKANFYQISGDLLFFSACVTPVYFISSQISHS